MGKGGFSGYVEPVVDDEAWRPKEADLCEFYSLTSAPHLNGV